ncbi:RNA polymerase sigma factor [Chitinophaga flava]|uniref:Sigma-70 family RNA polymerase sigma factor n=1 Tax=Chitinophaga flava TaxID=2259036 RepID=A0A365XPT1_9BACT|nr:sigma-70 family RNA polymerase sigma factor [Chitinophaga flava]RBL88128.1 sigma-70 family RNA polymerase sigma factor [Chitinophaga flava]
MENNELSEDQGRWLALQTGDKEALAYFFNTFMGSLYNYGLKFTQDEDVIEDTIQDLFIRLWDTRKRLSLPASVRNYLFKAFRNLLFRKLSRAEKTSRYASQYIFLDIEYSAETNHINAELQIARDKRLETALQKLPVRQKEAIYLRFYENASYEEIAQIMGTTVKACYKNVFRALSCLRETLITVITYLFFRLFFLN